MRGDRVVLGLNERLQAGVVAGVGLQIAALLGKRLTHLPYAVIWLSRLQLEDYSAAVIVRTTCAGEDAAEASSAVEIAYRVLDQACVGASPVRPPVKLYSTVSVPVASSLNTTPQP